ncbi:MAG: glycosyltransferase [Candidatus Krumholzibacteriota bacterium]|nr:glycosyltransferase [Candidatus Krumholzibacteriota bacterium]
MGEAGGILVLASTLRVGGGERVLAQLLLALRDRGTPLSLLLLKEPGPVGGELAKAGIPTRALGLGSTRHPRALLAVLVALRRDGAALLYVQDHHDCLFWGRLAAALAGFLPVLSPVHSSAQGGLRAFRAYNRLLLGLSPNLVTLGSWQEDGLRRREGLSPGFWVRVPNPVDGERLRPGPRREDGGPIILGTVAALRPEKRQDLLLDLAARLAGRREIELWLVGAGPEEAALRRRAEDLGIADRVRFWGRRDDVPALLARMDLFILTSAEEALPLSVLEALAAGVPVAAPPRGALPALLAGCGLLLGGEDPAGWVDQVDAFLAAPPAAVQRDAKARAVAAEHHPARFAERYARLASHLGAP